MGRKYVQASVLFLTGDGEEGVLRAGDKIPFKGSDDLLEEEAAALAAFLKKQIQSYVAARAKRKARSTS